MTSPSPQRPTPEQLLAQIELEERKARRGRLKVFLGYAGGVGKSFQMLDEGRRRRERGEDVVVCALQPEYPPEVQAILQKLEIIPTLKIGGAESIDVPAVIRRHPQVALIDGLAYDNPPGSPNPHRWQDVEQLLDAGISVVATVNLQYLERLQDEVERITGNRAATTIPAGFLDRTADEIVVVDAPARDGFWRDCMMAPAPRRLPKSTSYPACANWHCWSRLPSWTVNSQTTCALMAWSNLGASRSAFSFVSVRVPKPPACSRAGGAMRTGSKGSFMQFMCRSVRSKFKNAQLCKTILTTLSNWAPKSSTSVASTIPKPS